MKTIILLVSMVLQSAWVMVAVAAEIASPVKACIITRDMPLTPANRSKIAQCLQWHEDPNTPICRGYYEGPTLSPLPDANEIQITADEVSLYAEGRSELTGHVNVQQASRIVSAKTAYIYREAKTNKVTKIVLLNEVKYIEPDRYILARKATLNPEDKSGKIEDVLYRIHLKRTANSLPAWGRASLLQRFSNRDTLLRQATYTTCAPSDRSWEIEAKEIKLNNAQQKGVARGATVKIGNWPVLYTPYLSFPTTKKRKSGFLMPVTGFTNVGGFDLALPYYWNIAPNYDATFVPHEYTRRGLMLGGDFRFLTRESAGIFSGNFLPHDRAFNEFLTGNKQNFPTLRGLSNDRWSVLLHEKTAITSNLAMSINYQQVSDPYYLQDFSTNLASLTTNQLLRQGDLTYTTEHWIVRGMAQSYQTLHPINQSFITDIYERLPQFMASTYYTDLPMNATFSMLTQFDNFRWPGDNFSFPQGPRYHVNPVFALPLLKAWGYITPSIQVVENYYQVGYIGETNRQNFNRTIPRYNIDGSLIFERDTQLFGNAFTQTFEPRFFYLRVPYHNQSMVPDYESAYMIFNYDQLFRVNRFSAFDRIGDANQLTYAVTNRWIADSNGLEKASLSIGQIAYFAKRKVQLCYQQFGTCIDSPLFLGYVSPEASTSPIASRALYHFNRSWFLSGDYVWDPFTKGTNNGDLNFYYQPAPNHIINFGYTYLINGNILRVANDNTEYSPLHQASVGFAWPLTEQWSTLGGYSYNISKDYNMMSFLGFQYETCCWAARFMGGRAFKSLSPSTLAPQYNNHFYIQLLLKGLGSVAGGGPTSTINSYLPGYKDIFRGQY